MSGIVPIVVFVKPTTYYQGNWIFLLGLLVSLIMIIIEMESILRTVLLKFEKPGTRWVKILVATNRRDEEKAISFKLIVE